MLDGYREVRRVAEPEEYVAGVGAAASNLVEPILITVVASLELVGTGVAQLTAVVVDDSEINEGSDLERAVEIRDDPGECGAIAQLGERPVVDEEGQGRSALGQKELEGSFGIEGQAGHRIYRLRLQRLVELHIVDDHGDGQR